MRVLHAKSSPSHVADVGNGGDVVRVPPAEQKDLAAHGTSDAWTAASGGAGPLGAPAPNARSVLSLQLDKNHGAALAELIETALTDRHLSADEWGVIGSMVNMLPLMAAPECRQLLQVFAADHTMDRAVRFDVAQALRARGYPVPHGDQPVVDVARVIAQNVTETDEAFEDLCVRMGVPAAPQLVAVLDGGFDVTHPALSKGVTAAHADFSGGAQGIAGTDASHGTHVAALSTQGTQRLAPLCMNVLARSESGRSLALRGFVDAVEHAVAQGARVVNVSILTTDPAEVEQVRSAVLAHPEVLFVLGAGNDPLPLGEGKFAPELHVGAQAFPNVCVVTSARDDRLAGYAAWGGTTALAADGDVMSAVPRARFAFMSGTSMAAPQVTSVAARCTLLDPTLAPPRLQRILELTVDRHAGLTDVVRSGGALNGTRACRLAALARLVHGGHTLPDAFAKLAIPADEHATLSLLLRVLDA